MYAQFFGNYLLARNIVTGEQLIQAMHKKSSTQIRLGTLAIHAGYMTANEVDRLVIMQTHQDKRFGELAISEGYMTETQVTELLKKQKPDFLLLGQALIEDGIINNEQLQNLIIDYESENELEDFGYSAETVDAIDRMIENFFVLAERSLSEHETAYFRLLFNNLVRFIGDDFTLVPPSICTEYPTNHCVAQAVHKKIDLCTYVDMPQSIAIEFASRYVGDQFNVFDEYVQASLEDFLNLHNGIYIVNMSNDFSIELALDPPELESSELLSFDTEAYLLPIVYPFGTIHFIIELRKTY